MPEMMLANLSTTNIPKATAEMINYDLLKLYRSQILPSHFIIINLTTIETHKMIATLLN